MDRETVILAVLSGLCILSSFARLHIVKDAKTWTEAQSYCREKYTDLVTIKSEEDMVRLSHILWGNYSDDEVWIGLYGDINNWKWSLERDGFYEAGEAEFRRWHGLEPNDYRSTFCCTYIDSDGGWSDSACSLEKPFICYNEISETRFIYVSTPMNWPNAQRYCRENYTDLASARNIPENDEIKTLVVTYTWIGLYRESWKWSDGQPLRFTSFSNWNHGQPDKILQSCATTTLSKWNSRHCDNKYAFVCSEEEVRKQVVKVTMKKSDPSVDLEEMQDAILQKFKQRLKDHGLDGQVRLKWMKQADGKIFHLKDKKKDTEEQSCIP